jgi:hypothetical protein
MGGRKIKDKRTNTLNDPFVWSLFLGKNDIMSEGYKKAKFAARIEN